MPASLATADKTEMSGHLKVSYLRLAICVIAPKMCFERLLGRASK